MNQPVPESRKPVQGVVLSGGGASGAYEVGVLKALLTRGDRPLAPEVFTGTSIGSFNASFMVSQWDTFGRAAITNLEQVWRERLANRAGGLGANGLYRVRASPLDFLDPASYLPNPLRPFLRLAGDGFYFFFEALSRISTLPLGEGDLLGRAANLIDVSAALATEPWQETIGTLDFAAIRNSSRRLRIAATNFESGKLREFENRDMTDEMGPLAVRASSAIPGLLPAVAIGAQKHVDGSVVMNTPLTLGIKAGADELHVIYLDPSIDQIPVASLQSSADSSYRQAVIGWSKVVNENLAAAQRINSSVRAIERLRRDPRASAAVDLDRLADELHVRNLKAITVHRYHPHDDLAGGALGLLNFRPDHIGRLIDRGFEDTARHDCDESKCVLLEDGEVSESVPQRQLKRAAG
jgi:NTE family protein